MKNGDISQGLVHAFAHCAVWALALSACGSEIEVKVESGEEALKDRSELMALGTTDTLIKTGDGKLVITTELSAKGFNGPIIVRTGTIRVDAANAFGTGAFTIEDGASVEVGPTKNINPVFNATSVSVAGSGVGNGGALFANGSNQQSYLVASGGKTITLAGDTMFKCVAAGFGPCSGTLNLDGNKLVLDSGVFECRAAVLKGPGEVVLQNGNTFYLENTAITGTSGNADDTKVTVKSGCGLQIGGNKIANIDLSKCPWWTVVFEGAGSWYVQAWQTDAVFGWNGPVSLGGTVTFGGNGNVISNILSGAVSGDGGIVKNGVQTLVLSNPANAIGGDVTVSAGKLDYAGTIGGKVTVSVGQLVQNGTIGGDLSVSGGASASVSGAVGGKVTVADAATKVTVGGAKGGISGTSGKLVLDHSADLATTDDILYGYWRDYTDNSTTELTTDTPFEFGVAAPDGYVFKKDLDDVIVSHVAPGTLTVASETDAATAFKNMGGELVLAPPTSQAIGWLDVRSGTVTIAAGATVTHPTNNATVAAQYPDLAKLAVKGAFTTEDHRMGVAPQRNAVSKPSGTVRGVVEVFNGATVTNIYQSNVNDGFVRAKYVNGNSNVMSSWYQHGGDVALIGDDLATARAGVNTSTHYFPGVGACYYYSLEGGTYSHCDARDVRMSSTADTYGIFAQSGGTNTMQRNAGMVLGAGDGRVIYCLTGGLLKGLYSTFPTCKENWEREYPAGGCHAYITLDGPTAVADLPVYNNESSVRLCSQVDSLSEVNVRNGARLGVNSILKTVSANLTSKGVSGRITNSVVRVNFDGGTLDLNTDYSSGSNNIIFTNFIAGVDHVRIYEGGLTVDTSKSSGRDRYVGAAFETPTGNGVSEISLTAEMDSLPAWEHTGAPWVEIVDPSGVGTGATAVAVFDTTLGKVTSVKVMNRGNDYPSDGVYAKVSLGGSPNVYELPCTVTPNVSGGLTKKGAGTLVLDWVCTYTGKTVLAGGALKLGVDGAIRAESRFMPMGGTLDMNGMTLSDGSGSVTNWGLDVALARVNGVGQYAGFTFPTGSTLVVENADKLPAEGVDEGLRKVVLMDVLGELVNPPTPTFVRPVTKGWSVRWIGNKLKAVRDRGTMLIIR